MNITLCRLPALVASVVMALQSSPFLSSAEAAETASGILEFHVSPTGAQPFTSTDPAVSHSSGKLSKYQSGIACDYWLSAPGTADKPFATLFQAQLAVREIFWKAKSDKTLLPKGGIKIIVHGGTYRLSDTLNFVPEDSGTPGCPVSYEAASGEKPVVSGGVLITGWTQAQDVPGLPDAAKGKVWVADAPEIGASTLDFRQMYVNGNKAVRARTPNMDDKEFWKNLVKWDIPDRLVYTKASDAGPWRNLKRVEMIVNQSWCNHVLRIDSIKTEGDLAAITFQQPERDIVFSKPWPWAFDTNQYHFENAIEFLDEPGEWYLDIKEGKVYYWPREGEDMAKAEVVAPRLETLVHFNGTAERPVHDIQIKGITFEDSTWMRPSQSGRVELQAGQYIVTSYRLHYGAGLDSQSWTERPPAGVLLSGVAHIGFERCVFRNMGSAGLDVWHSSVGTQVQGCVFEEIAGNGVQIARFSEDGFEAHVPYNAPDGDLCIGDRVANCVVRHCGTEDRGAIGIAAGYARGLTIEHNDVSDLPYSGISLGWGWTGLKNAMSDNSIRFNCIHDFMKVMEDGGGIYTLSNQPNSEIRGNFIYDPHFVRATFKIYFDEGSSGFTEQGNLEDGKGGDNRNHCGSISRIDGATGTSGPIADKAGLEPEYQDLLKSPSP